MLSIEEAGGSMKSIATLSVVCAVIVSACATAALPTTTEDGGSPDVNAGTNDSSANDVSTAHDSAVMDVVSNCQVSPPSNVCGVFPQCGCGAMQTCEVNQTTLDGSSSCIQAGTSGVGEPCTATLNQCAAGLTCVWGECHPYCGTAGATCSNPGTNTCVNLTSGTTMANIPNFLVCHIDCQLQDATSCNGTGEGCIIFSDGSTDCYAVGTASTCSASTQCKPGDECVYDGVSTYTCVAWCRVGLNDCTSGTCNAFGTPVMVGSQEYGYCM
jgi:hypothetical protein